MTEYVSRQELRRHYRKRLPPRIAVSRVYDRKAPTPVEGRRIRFRYSDETVDRLGDRILAKGWDLQAYLQNPVALFGHDASRPENVIGRSVNLAVKATELIGDIDFAPEDVNPTGDLVFRLYRGGFMSAVSVGFEPIDFEYVSEKGRDGGIDYKRQRLLEISAVPIPANPNALALARSKGIDTTPLRRWAERAIDENRTLIMSRASLETVARQAGPGMPRGRWKNKSRAEMLEMLAADEAADALHTSSTQSVSLTPHGYGEPPVRERHGRDALGISVGRFVAGALIAAKSGKSAGAAFVERHWKDRRVAAALVKALSTTGTSTGGALIPQEFAAELIELLRAETVFRRAGPRTLLIEEGNLTIPRQTAAAVAGYVGELDDLMASQPSFDDVQLNLKKLTALVPVSNDLLRRAPIDMDATLRDDMKETIARREDIAFLLGDGSGESPIGLLNQCVASQKFNVLPFQAYDNTTLLTQSIGTLRSLQMTMKQNMSRMIRPAWISVPGTFEFLKTLRDDMGGFILAPEMEKGSLLETPFYATQQLPSNLAVMVGGSPELVGAYLILADMSDLILADGLTLKIDTSDSASYLDPSGAMVSAFSRDQTMFRATTEHDVALRHSASVLIATLPGWCPPGFNATNSGSPFFSQGLSGDGSAAASTWGTPPTGSSNPGSRSAVAPGGTMPGRV